jgi:hypothetical protein
MTSSSKGKHFFLKKEAKTFVIYPKRLAYFLPSLRGTDEQKFFRFFFKKEFPSSTLRCLPNYPATLLSDQGLITLTPAARNGPVSRVATLKPRLRAMAAICPSANEMALPAVRARLCTAA